MNAGERAARARQGHRLVQAGVLVFLLGLIVGLLVPAFTVPRLGLSAHLLGITQGLFLTLLGLVWPRLRLSRTVARGGVGLAIYGCAAPFIANVLGASWGAGRTLLPMAAGGAAGSAAQETAIAAGLRTGGAALILVTLVVLWGLRGDGPPEP